MSRRGSSEDHVFSPLPFRHDVVMSTSLFKIRP
jgi:hypothetical protein